MKNVKLRILGSLLVCAWGVCWAGNIILGQKSFSSLMEAQTFLETVIQLEEIQITHTLPYAMVYSLLEQQCDNSKNDKQIQLLKSLWGQNIPGRKLQTELKKYFDTLKKMILVVNNQKDEQRFCFQKYLLYVLLERTQQLYANTVSGIPSTPVIETAMEQTMVAAEPEPLPQHQSATEKKENAETLLQRYLSLRNDLQNIEENHFILLAELAEKLIQKELWILLEHGFLNDQDIAVLDGKIEISYVHGCGITRGSYHMTQKAGGADKKLTAIKLNINLCSTTSYVYNFENYVRQIFMHELAHYLYFFKDSSASGFGNICRKNGESLCQSEDFVSTYAQKSKEEDYAESFTHRYVQHYADRVFIVSPEHGSANTSLKSEVKRRYFDQAYGS